MNNPVQCPQCHRKWLIGVDGRTRNCDQCGVRAVALKVVNSIQVSDREAESIKRRFIESRIREVTSRRRRRNLEP